MSYSSNIKHYMGCGLAADRPDILNLTPGALGIYHASDTDELWLWVDNDHWESRGSGGEGIPDAPSDGKLYGRKDAAWEEVPGGGGAVDSVNGRTGAVTLTAADTPSPVVTLSGTAYDMGDLTPGAWHVFTSGSAVTITVEDDSVEPVPANAEYGLECRGAGGITLVEDSIASIIPPKGGMLVLEQADFAVLKRTAADEYKLVGSTVAA